LSGLAISHRPEVGAEFYVSRNTVESQTTIIPSRLGVAGLPNATEEARRLGLV
jgi:hypothetical protein